MSTNGPRRNHAVHQERASFGILALPSFNNAPAYCWWGVSGEAGAGAAPGWGNSTLPSRPNTSNRGFIAVVASALNPGLGVPPEPPIRAMYCFPSTANAIGGPMPLQPRGQVEEGFPLVGRVGDQVSVGSHPSGPVIVRRSGVEHFVHIGNDLSGAGCPTEPLRSRLNLNVDVCDTSFEDLF